MNNFKIQVEDESSLLPEFIVDENTNFMLLYDWQRRAIEFFNKNNTCIFEVTTGAGKTFFAIEIIKRLFKEDEDLKVLIVVPKNIILEDTWFKQLYEFGFTMADVGVYYGFTKEYGRKITITNMQNLEKVALEMFDMAIFDEIHNYGTKRLLPFLKYPFKYKIGLSATVERGDKMHWEIIKIFNYKVFKYTPQEALRDDILNPFNFVNIAVEMDDENYERYDILTQEINTLLRMGGGYKKIMASGTGLKNKLLKKMTERKELVNNYSRKFDVVKLICEEHKQDKIIIFNEFNEQTSRSYWYLLDIGVKACVVHSTMPKKKREENLIGFKNDRYQVMLATKVLDEGYNLPKLDVAIIAAGNSTSRQTIQRMGRVLRKKNKESMLYQVYVKNTIEENYSEERAKLFKELCTKYHEYLYKLDGELVL